MSEPASRRALSMWPTNWPNSTALRIAPAVAGPRITYVSWAEMPMTLLTYAGASAYRLNRTRTAMLTWPNASLRARDARKASTPSFRSRSINRKRLRLSSTGDSVWRANGGISDAKISVPAMTSSTTAHQYGAYRSILETTGASTPPTTRVRTIVSKAIELAVISILRGRMVGITAASAGPKSWPTAEKTSVMKMRCKKSFLTPGTSEAIGISATTAARPKLHHIMIRFRFRRSAITPAGGAKRTAGTVYASSVTATEVLPPEI